MEFAGLKDVADFIKNNDNFLIVHHIDADGITSAAIACKMLKRFGKKFNYVSAKQLDHARISEFKEKSDVLIFVDLGSGQLETLNSELNEKKFCVIDHHKPHGATNSPHFNAHLSGIDGTDEISGAGTVYLVAKHIDEKNKDISKLAIVGAIGDMQDSKGRLDSLNREILKDAEELNLVREFKDIKLFGRHSRPLVQFLSFCTEPFFPGLTAKEDECIAFLRNLQIELKNGERWRTYNDLSQEEKKRLISGLYVHGINHNMPDKMLKSLVGEVYELLDEKEGTELRDAREFATLLNACGRHGSTDIGVKVCLGDRGLFYAEAKELLQKHRQALRDGIQWVQDNGVRELQNLYVIEAEGKIEDTLIGVIAGMLYGAGVIGNQKPVIGLSMDEKQDIKISGRATWQLVAQGIDLGDALKEAAESVAGAGGGHKVAAGAAIPKHKKEDFLIQIDKIIGEQLNAKKI